MAPKLHQGAGGHGEGTCDGHCRFGGPNEFTLEEIDIPDPGPGQLLVRVVAFGTNPVDAVLPLEDVAKAHQRLDSGHGRGKIVLRVVDAPL